MSLRLTSLLRVSGLLVSALLVSALLVSTLLLGVSLHTSCLPPAWIRGVGLGIHCWAIETYVLRWVVASLLRATVALLAAVAALPEEVSTMVSPRLQRRPQGRLLATWMAWRARASAERLHTTPHPPMPPRRHPPLAERSS